MNLKCVQLPNTRQRVQGTQTEAYILSKSELSNEQGVRKIKLNWWDWNVLLSGQSSLRYQRCQQSLLRKKDQLIQNQLIKVVLQVVLGKKKKRVALEIQAPEFRRQNLESGVKEMIRHLPSDVTGIGGVQHGIRVECPKKQSRTNLCINMEPK